MKRSDDAIILLASQDFDQLKYFNRAAVEGALRRACEKMRVVPTAADFDRLMEMLRLTMRKKVFEIDLTFIQ